MADNDEENARNRALGYISCSLYGIELPEKLHTKLKYHCESKHIELVDIYHEVPPTRQADVLDDPRVLERMLDRALDPAEHIDTIVLHFDKFPSVHEPVYALCKSLLAHRDIRLMAIPWDREDREEAYQACILAVFERHAAEEARYRREANNRRNKQV